MAWNWSANGRTVANFNYFLWGKVCSIFVLLCSESLRNVTTPYTRLLFLFTRPLKMEQTAVPKRRHVKFRRRGIAQEKEYNKDLLPNIGHSIVWDSQKGPRGIAAHIIDLNTVWRLVTSHPSPLTPGEGKSHYPFSREIGGPQSWRGRFVEEKICCLCWE